MRFIFTFLFIFLFSFIGFAQLDSSIKTLPIETSNPNIGLSTSNQGLALKVPSIITPASTSNLRDSLTARQINMLPNTELVDAGRDLKINPRLGLEEKTKKGSRTYYGDQYLGDVKSSGKFVGIVCRDHENVDNDRIKIYVNNKIVDKNILLTGNFKGVNVDLVDGFNRIEFEAINEGEFSPNTAQIQVYDDLGKLLYSGVWNLSTGSKATVIVVK